MGAVRKRAKCAKKSLQARMDHPRPPISCIKDRLFVHPESFLLFSSFFIPHLLSNKTLVQQPLLFSTSPNKIAFASSSSILLPLLLQHLKHLFFLLQSASSNSSLFSHPTIFQQQDASPLHIQEIAIKNKNTIHSTHKKNAQGISATTWLTKASSLPIPQSHLALLQMLTFFSFFRSPLNTFAQLRRLAQSFR